MAGGDYNLNGRYFEVLFKAECLKRHLCVLSPEHTHLAFDVAIFSAGRFITVQVKGTTRINHASGRGGREARFQCCGNMKNRALYRDRGVDYLAAYVQPLERWYIIPSTELSARTFAIRFSHDAKAAQWAERWDVLGAAPVPASEIA